MADRTKMNIFVDPGELVKVDATQAALFVLKEEGARIEELELRRLQGEEVEGELQDIAESISVRNGLDRTNPKDSGRMASFLSGFKLAPVSVQNSRLSVCRLCEHSRRLGPNLGDKSGILQCKQCGCIMNAKVRLANAVCPEKKF